MDTKNHIVIKKIVVLLTLFLAFFSCKENTSNSNVEEAVLWQPYNDSAEVAANKDHPIERMRYRLIQSKVLDKNDIFLALNDEVLKMTESEYETIKPIVLEQNIFDLRQSIDQGKLTYEKLVLFYLYRIYKYELDNTTTLNTVVALDREVVEQARELDRMKTNGLEPSGKHPIYGMPILLKDNINTQGMNTTAGSLALIDNVVEDAFIVKQLKKNGALILGKVNMSEWAYFLCSGCPVGYSAYGGQTLNPYGRRIFETGGSSSGSGTSVAANFAVAAVGTETSGSILSPSSQNSVVGLKPTIGLLSRSGIVPISSTLDTPGPMTKNVRDNAILLSAMLGKDETDPASVAFQDSIPTASLIHFSLEGKRFGVFKSLLDSDSIYSATIEKIRGLGAEIIEFTPPKVDMEGFRSILNIDMKNDLPKYLSAHSNPEKVKIKSIAELVQFNAADSLVRIPYGQALFEGILADSTSVEALEEIKTNLKKNGRTFFDVAMDKYGLDAILSINNYHASYAAVAMYPALTVPMGYKTTGEPIGLTFIGKPFTETNLLYLGSGFESAVKIRKMPEAYK